MKNGRSIERPFVFASGECQNDDLGADADLA
jgi:hypothetical protein